MRPDRLAVVGVDTFEPAEPDGGRRCATIPMESVPHTAALVLRLGADAQAVAPPELVTHLTGHVRALARLYPWVA